MKVTVTTRSGRELIDGGLVLDSTATVADLQEAIHQRIKKYYPSRQRLTLPFSPHSKEKPIILQYKKCLKDYINGNSDTITIVFKDLGPQVSYLANLYCHIILRNLRSPNGSEGYQIPCGFLFNIVTCANYTTEIYQWLGFNVATQTVAGYIFLVVAASIMTNWALAKHRRLIKVFDGKDGRAKYPSGRWVILPPFL
ncbi:hypothetical protein L6452_14353 [Arctium lappa]|uniref:Uncharacterized protein n=1 Tax=Arctium lappa TaxID=4217 RepID=A0ACB9CKM1_ARCLA|nr:hypothetical protein L6452_14353 [Arctium lappa]